MKRKKIAITFESLIKVFSVFHQCPLPNANFPSTEMRKVFDFASFLKNKHFFRSHFLTNTKLKFAKFFLLSIHIIITTKKFRSNKVSFDEGKYVSNRQKNEGGRNRVVESSVFAFLLTLSWSKQQPNIIWTCDEDKKKIVRFIFYSFNCTNLIQANNSVLRIVWTRAFSLHSLHAQGVPKKLCREELK